MKNSGSGGDEFRPYHGDFLISPCPTQLSLNWCSAGCAYCFANLSSPGREADAVRMTNFLSNLRNKGTLVARLLQDNYPILISNLIDPFAASNYTISVPIMETLTELGIPIAVQTRGSFGIDDVLSFLPSSHWYLSIPYLNEDRRKRLEPGAAPINYRLDLISRLREKGHRVSVGLNPLVPEWISRQEVDWLLDKLVELGVEGVWIATLHFDNGLLSNMPQRDRFVLTEPIIKRAQLKTSSEEEDELFRYAMERARVRGLSVYDGAVPFKSDYMQPMFDLYPRRFPVFQEFINWCFDTNPTHPISFAEFRTSLGGSFPSGVWKVRDYYRSMQVKLADHLSEFMTYEQLLKIYWNEGKAWERFFRLGCFALWAEDEGETIVRDEEGMVYFWFRPEGWGGRVAVAAN